MSISHLTSTPVFQSGTGNRTVTPHASTAVGDLMFLVVAFQDSAATTISTPTGWTVDKNAVQTGTLKTSLFRRTFQTGDTTWTYAPNQSVETSHIVLTVPGADPATVVFGADGTRAASGGTTATTAPSVTTPVADVRAFVIATERTTANETVEATVNNSFTKILHMFQNGTSAESIFLGYRDIPTPATIGATTVTFQNSQATNGYAVLATVAALATSQAASGTIAATTALSGVASTRHPASGLVAAVTVVTGNSSTKQQAGATVSAVSGVAGGATSTHTVSGIVSAVSTTTGSANTTQYVSGVLSAVTVVAGTATASGQAEAQGAVAATSVVVGVAVTSHTAAGRIDAVSIVAGASDTRLNATGAVAVTTTVTGAATGGVFSPFQQTLTLTVTIETLTLDADIPRLELPATVPQLTMEAAW